MKFLRGTLDVGFVPEVLEQPVYMRGGAAALGDVRRLDISASDAAVTGISTFGSATDGCSNAIAVGTNIASGVYVVVSEAAADDAEGKAVMSGFVRVKVADGVEADDLLCPVASGVTLDQISATAATARAVAIACEDKQADGMALCMFDGCNGFGTDLAT